MESICKNEFGKCRIQASDCFTPVNFPEMFLKQRIGSILKCQQHQVITKLLFLGMSLFLKNVAFHGILLDSIFNEGNQEWELVSELLKKGIKDGVVKPLRSTVFNKEEVEAAFRFMAQGKHIGKVMIKVMR